MHKTRDADPGASHRHDALMGFRGSSAPPWSEKRTSLLKAIAKEGLQGGKGDNVWVEHHRNLHDLEIQQEPTPFPRPPPRWRPPPPPPLQLPPPATGECRRPPARPQPRTPRATPAARAGPQQRRLVPMAEVAQTGANGLG